MIKYFFIAVFLAAIFSFGAVFLPTSFLGLKKNQPRASESSYKNVQLFSDSNFGYPQKLFRAIGNSIGAPLIFSGELDAPEGKNFGTAVTHEIFTTPGLLTEKPVLPEISSEEKQKANEEYIASFLGTPFPEDLSRSIKEGRSPTLGQYRASMIEAGVINELDFQDISTKDEIKNFNFKILEYQILKGVITPAEGESLRATIKSLYN
jgi:hypothetical protein